MELDTTLKQKLRKRFPAKPVLAISGCLTLLGSIWSSTLLTRAASADYTITDASVVLDGTNPGTATVSLKTAVAHTYIGLQGTWSLTETTSAGNAGTTYLALSGTSRGNSVSMPFGATNGNVIWSPEDGAGMAIAVGGNVLSATYTVDADTPEGEYMVSISNGIMGFNDNGAGDEWDDGIALLATITVSRSSSDPTDPGTTDPDDPGTTTDPDDPGTTDPDPGTSTDPDDPGTSTDPGSGTTDPGTSTDSGNTNPDSGSTTNSGTTTNPDTSASDSKSGTPTTLPKTSASTPNTGLTTKDNAAANQGVFAFFLVSTASTIVIFGTLASQTLKRKSVRSFGTEE